MPPLLPYTNDHFLTDTTKDENGSRKDAKTAKKICSTAAPGGALPGVVVGRAHPTSLSVFTES
jgi:hypothetical protein